MKNLLLFFCIILGICSAQKNVCVIVNGESILQKELDSLIAKSYGDEAEGLKDSVIKAHLSEMIIFKIMEQKLKKISVRIPASEYEEDADRYAQPFLTYYAEWGLKNQYKFIPDLRAIVAKKDDLQKKYGDWLKDREYRVLNTQDYKMMLDIWQDIVTTKEFKPMVRERACNKYRMEYSIFKDRIRLITKLRMHVLQSVTTKEIEDFIKREEFALSDGLIRMKHLLVTNLDLDTMELLPQEKQLSILQKVERIRAEILPDLSNFDEKVAQHSDHTANKFQKGDLGWVPRWGASTIFGGFLAHLGWIPPFVDELPEIIEQGYILQTNTLSQPIQTKWGHHLIVVTERKKGPKEIDKTELHKRAKNMIALLKMESMLREWLQSSKIEYKQ